MIKFQGLLGRTFGGFLTIRGTAKFSDIVKYSEAKEYQRKTIPEHLIENIITNQIIFFFQRLFYH